MAKVVKAKKEKKQGTGFRFDFKKMLILFALVPLIVSVVIITAFLVNQSKNEIKEVMHNYMYSMAVAEGSGLADEINTRGAVFALADHNLQKYCEDIGLENVESSYCYVADKDGIMLYHPTADKIGQPVTNDVILGVCANMAAGQTIEPDVVEYVFKGENKYAAYYVSAKNDFVLVITADESDVMSDVTKIVVQGVLMAVLLVAIFVALALFLTQKVVAPMRVVVHGITEVAEGNLDADIKAKSNIYELKRLLESAQTLQNVLQKTIGETQSISATLKDGAENVAHLAENSKDGSNQISQAMEDLAQGATSMAENVQVINEQVIDMGASIESISDNADQLVTMSNAIREANTDAAEYIAKVSTSSEKSVSAVSAIGEQINATNDSVNKIKDAADMIGAIARKTNLLALNASIEAARAGEAGKGFAVVADEIKNLSEQSNASADEIREVVSEVMAQSSRSVDLAGQVSEIISEEQGYIGETEKKFEVLNREIGNSMSEIQGISEKVTSLNEAKDAIMRSVSDLGAISEENAASNQEVSASVTQIAEAITSIADNSESTNEMAVSLNDTVSYFK